MSDVLRFWALCEVVGLLATPVAGAFFARLPGGGLALARPLGLLLLAYPIWLLAGLRLAPYGGGSPWFGLGLLAACGAAGGLVLHRRRGFPSPQPGALRLWVVGELLFGLSLFAWALLRAYAPDVWGTEKPMDMAFINAINRSPWMPPNDPWLSGSTINYYYFGHFITALLVRATGVEPSVGFNLGVALFYALSVTGVYGVASALAAAARQAEEPSQHSPAAAGLVAAAFAMVLGNLAGAAQLLQRPGPLDRFDWWSPSRVIADTITEFPFFSFLLADLHAHMMAAPFGLLALALALRLAFAGPSWPRQVEGRGGQPERAADRGRSSTAVVAAGRVASPWLLTMAGLSQRPRAELGGTAVGWASPPPLGTGTRLPARSTTAWPAFARAAAAVADLALASLVVGCLYAFNGWDYPTQLGIGGLCLLLHATGRPERGSAWWPLVGWALAWAALSFLFFLPFTAHFHAPTGGLGLVRAHASFSQMVHDYALIYGLPAWVIGAALAHRLRSSGVALRHVTWGAIAAVALLTLLMPGHLAGVALLLALCLAALHAALDVSASQPTRVWWLLAAVAIGLATVGELVYIRDAFDHGPDYRMNTVFKFGYQAWFIAMIFAGCGVARCKAWLTGGGRTFWSAGLALLVLAALVYPVAATYSREGGFQATPSLDGLGWLQARSPGDVAAIRWLQATVVGAPVVVEAVGGQYDPVGHARISTFTGLPAVLGWAGHEGEWGHDPGQRDAEVRLLYSTTDLAAARAVLERYDVRYVVVGALERSDFPATGLAKFDRLGTAVFAASGATIYEVRR